MSFLNNLKDKTQKFGQRWTFQTTHGLRIDYKKKDSVDEGYYKNLKKKKLMAKKADIHAQMAELEVE